MGRLGWDGRNGGRRIEVVGKIMASGTGLVLMTAPAATHTFFSPTVRELLVVCAPIGYYWQTRDGEAGYDSKRWCKLLVSLGCRWF